MESAGFKLGADGAEVRPESTVLVVDDDEHVRRTLGRILRGRFRGKVVLAADAQEGLGVLAREPIQAVVSDYRMPGMSGVEFLRVVKERWPAIQRVLLTGQADSSAIEEAVNQAEIFRFIWKPWDDSHLLATIQSAVDQFWIVEENHRLQRLVAERNDELERVNRDLDARLAQRSAALVRAAQEWRASFDAIGDPMAILRAGGCEVVRSNTAFARAAGVVPTELAGLRCADHAFGTLPCPARCAMTFAGPAEREVVFGERTWLLRSFPFDGAEDGGAVVLFKDVTDEREVGRRLFHAEKMSAVGQLAGGVAHEINNPLGGILAFAQMMAREKDRSDEDRESLRLIQDAALRAKRIVESLLRFSRRPKPDERGQVDLTVVCDDALFLLLSQLKDRKYEVVREYQAAVAVGNANQLQQIVVNLVVNAIQAMPGGGRVVVGTGSAGPGRVRFSVTDEGAGIPEEVSKRIFEPFFTTKPEGQGTGLGLSICYQIAEEHGGSIRVENAPGMGASFSVELPAATVEARSDEGENR
jgi:two-component system NtrC family sensor kinase